MDKDILASDKAHSTMRQCYNRQQEGIIKSLLQSMSLPLSMIGSSFQVHAESRVKGHRLKDSVELTACQRSCPAPTHPCRDPPKHEDECDGDEYDEEEDCEDCEEECDGDEYREEEDDCEEKEEEEEDCIEEEEEEECIEEEEEEDCIEEEEEEEEDCIEEEEEEEECIEEEEDEEDCIEEEEEEEECIEEEPKPKNPPPEKKCQEKETQPKDCVKEKVCNGKRQICLEAPKENTKKKQELKSELRCKTKSPVDSRKGSESKRDCKKYTEKSREIKKETENKKVSKKDKECCTTAKETRKKKDCSKERKKEKSSKKESDCKKEIKKQTDCYAEDELKKICRKYRDYDCIPPWIEDKPRPRQPNCKCYRTDGHRETGTRQTKDYKTPSSRECNEPEMEDDDDEECDDDEPAYHPQKDNCKICENHFSKEETRYAETDKRDDPVYYFNKKFTDRKLKDWEKCSGDAQNTKNEFRNSRKNLEAHVYLSERGHFTKRSPYTESNIYLHAPKFETLSGGNVRRSPDIHFHLNTLGTYTRPNVNNNYNGYVAQNEDVYTSQDVYSPNEDNGNYTTHSSNANELCASYTTEANSYHYTVETCSFTRIMDAGGESSDGESVLSDDDKAIVGFESSPLRLEHGVSVPSLVAGREDNERIKLRDLAEFVGADGDKQQRERSQKYERYGQTSVGDDDDYYTAHNVCQSCEDDVSTQRMPVASVSLDDQIYTTRVYTPVQRLSRKKSPAPSMFDNEHLIMESMSEGSSESLAESENELRHSAIRHTKRLADSGSFASSLSDFTNNPFENLKRVIASIKKKALGIEDEIQANVVETVQAKGESLKPHLSKTRNEIIQPSYLQETVSDVVQSSVPKMKERFCVNVNNDTKKAHRIASFTSVKEKKIPHFLVRSERKAKHFVQLTSQPITTRHPFQRKYETTETNSENKPGKPHLLSKTARAQKDCHGNATADNVMNDIVEVLAKPEIQKLKVEPFPEPSQTLLNRTGQSSLKAKNWRLSKETHSAGSREHKIIPNPSVQIQTLNYIGKDGKSGGASSNDRNPSRAQSYSVTSTRTRSVQHNGGKPAFKKVTAEKQFKSTVSAKKPSASSSRRSLSAGRTKSPGRTKSADKQTKNNGFLFSKFYQKKENAETKNTSEKDSKKMDFIHVTEAIARSLPFFKRNETAQEKETTKTLNVADHYSPTLEIPVLTESGKIETKKIGFRTFNSVSREKDESNVNTQKFMRRSAISHDVSPKNSFTSKPKKIDVSGDMAKVPFPWQSPRVMEIGPMTNGQKLYDYRKSRKRDNVIISTPPPSPPITIAPIESHEAQEPQEDELDAFHERIISMEMCESAKMIRKKIRQVNYVPDSNIYESSESSSSEDDECLSVKSSKEDEPVSGSWYCDVPVNIVRTQELYRNQKKTNSIMDEIINLTKQRTLSESIGEYMTEGGGGADVKSLSDESKAHEASNCDQSNVSPKSINSFSEDHTEEEYCNIYTSDVHVDNKDDLKDSETFLSFNKSMFNHIGRILGIRDSNQSNGIEQQREEKIDDECQPSFEVDGNEQVTCSFVPAPEQTKDSENKAERVNHNISPLHCKKSADDADDETVVKQCRFNVEPSGTVDTSPPDNIVHVNSSPPRTFPRKMPFQSSANLLLAATNKLARSNSEMYLRMKNQSKSVSEQSPVANVILHKTSPFKSKSVEKNGKPIKNSSRQSMSRTAPTPIGMDNVNRKTPVAEVSTYNSDVDTSIPKRTNIWSKFTRDKSGDSKPKKDAIETLTQDFVKRTASSPDAAAKSRKNYKNSSQKKEKTKSSKSLPQVLSHNKLLLQRGLSPTKSMESNSKIKKNSLSTSTALNIQEKNQDKSAPAISKPHVAPGSSPKPSATLLHPSFIQDEPKQTEIVKTNPLKKSVEKRAKSPISSVSKNKNKTIFNKTETSTQSKKDSLKAVSSRSREALKAKSGLDISPKKATIFKSLQEGKKNSTAIIKSDITISDKSLKSDKNMTEKNRIEPRSRPESYIDWKNKSKLSRLSDGQQAEVSNEERTNTHPEERSSTHESNIEEKKYQLDRRHATENNKNLKITPFDNRKFEKKISSELRKETEKTSMETLKEEEKQFHMQQESRPEDLKSITERHLEEVRKKYQPIKEEKVVKNDVQLDEPKATPSSQDVKPEDFKTARERRMHETRKKYQRHSEEVNSEDSKMIQQTSLSEAEKRTEDSMSNMERHMQELKKKYQRTLEKKFSNTNLTKEVEHQNKSKSHSNKPQTTTTGRIYAPENRKTKHLSVSESSQMDKPEPVNTHQRNFKSLGKADIFDIPQAAGKRPRKQGKSFRSRSRSRSRTNILSPKMNRKSEAKVPYYPPTVLDKDSDKQESTDNVIVDTVKVQEPLPQPRGAAAYKIESSSGKSLNIKKQTTKQPDVTMKQQDASILSSAFVAIGDALTALKSSVPSGGITMPDSLSQHIATGSDQKQSSQKGEEGKKSEKTVTTSVDEAEASYKGTTHRTGATDTQSVRKVSRVQSDRVIGTYAGPASFSIKRDVTGKNEPIKRHVTVNDLKPAPYTPVYNYDNRADAPVNDNMYYNSGSYYRAYQSEPLTPKPLSEIPRRIDKEAEEYLKYSDFRHQIYESNRQSARRSINEPRHVSYQLAKNQPQYKGDAHPSSSYKISKQGGTSSVKPIQPSEILPPTMLNTPTKQPSPKIPEPVDPAPKNIPLPVPQEKASAPTEIVDKSSTDTSTFGMISKFINTIKRSAAFEQNFSEKKDNSKNNNNSNSILDDVLNSVQSKHEIGSDYLVFPNNTLTSRCPESHESHVNISINSISEVIKTQSTFIISDIVCLRDGLTQDLELNCNNSADSYIELRRRIRQDRLEHEKKSSSTNEKIHFSQDSQTEQLSQEGSDSKINARRFKNVHTGLASCCDSDMASFITLNTLIEWNFILMAVLIALLIGTLVPGSLTNIFACPLPSVYKGLYNYVLGPLGLDIIIFKWFTPAKTSVWKSPFAPKEPRIGLFYSFVYQLIVVSAKLILFILNYILIPLLSVPFLVLGPIISALMNATLCTVSTVMQGIYAFFLSMVGLNVDNSGLSQTKAGASSQPVSSAASSEDSGEMFNKLNEIQQYASVFVYFGQHNMKKECNYSFLTSFYLWITNQRSPECM